MFSTYLKSAFRSLKRNKTYSLLNILGLATGMAACIVILLFVFYENSFDSMHHRNIYRRNTVQQFVNTATPDRMAITKDKEFSEIAKIISNRLYQFFYVTKSA